MMQKHMPTHQHANTANVMITRSPTGTTAPIGKKTQGTESEVTAKLDLYGYKRDKQVIMLLVVIVCDDEEEDANKGIESESIDRLGWLVHQRAKHQTCHKWQ